MPRTKPPQLDPETERKLAAGLYNQVWRLMEMPDRTAEQTDSMIHAAHASRYHWEKVGARPNLARGEWLCSRVYAILGRPEAALWHARRCLELLQSSDDKEDWDLAAAYEALARAHVVAGNEAEARKWLALGAESAAAISDPEDRKPIETDLRSLRRPEVRHPA